MLDELKSAKKFVGIKQTLKAIDKGIVLKAFIASDADSSLTEVIKGLCEKNNIEVEICDSMQNLGSACGINIGAACAVIIK